MPGTSNNQVKPASKCIWYVLATVVGEPQSADELLIINRNRELWNGIMARRMGPGLKAALEAGLDRTKDLPDLRDVDKEDIKRCDEEFIKRALAAHGFTLDDIPNGHQPIDFSNVEFDKFVSFDGFVFYGVTNFQGAKFNDCAIFTNAVFYDEALFRAAKFEMLADFNGTTFSRSADFNGAQFLDRAELKRTEFKGRAQFEDTTFSGSVEFISATFFHQGVFNRAKFFDFAEFDHAKFNDCAIFNEATFSDLTGFGKTTFSDVISFRSAKFEFRTSFRGTRFEKSVPAFFKAQISADTDWQDATWPAIPDDLNVRSYENLVLAMDNLGKVQDRHFFFRKEMQTRRHTERQCMFYLGNALYDCLCDYGYGLGRIFCWWSGHVVIGAGLIFATAPWPDTSDAMNKLVTALGISFSNAHPFLGLNRTYLADTIKILNKAQSSDHIGLFNVIGYGQTFLGVILLFFLLLTIRNRFRMR